MHKFLRAVGFSKIRKKDLEFITEEIIEHPEVMKVTRDSEGNDTINVCTRKGADNSILKLDDAIKITSAARAELGAYQNRLESTKSSLDVSSYNMTNAMSRIMDTDMADAMTEYTQLNVLQQAATSMLSQANSKPEQIMSILQGM